MEEGYIWVKIQIIVEMSRNCSHLKSALFAEQLWAIDLKEFAFSFVSYMCVLSVVFSINIIFVYKMLVQLL